MVRRSRVCLSNAIVGDDMGEKRIARLRALLLVSSFFALLRRIRVGLPPVHCGHLLLALEALPFLRELLLRVSLLQCKGTLGWSAQKCVYIVVRTRSPRLFRGLLMVGHLFLLKTEYTHSGNIKRFR